MNDTSPLLLLLPNKPYWFHMRMQEWECERRVCGAVRKHSGQGFMNFICDNNNFLASEDCNSAIIVNPNLIFWKRLHGRCESCTVVLAVTVLSEFSSVSLHVSGCLSSPVSCFLSTQRKGREGALVYSSFFTFHSTPFPSLISWQH